MKKPIILLALVFAININAQIITTIAGNGFPGFSGDGGLATATKLQDPSSVAFDAAGNMYIADHYNSRVRKINSSGIISTIAGNGTSGFSGDGGPATAAQLYYPICVAFDRGGNLLIVDQPANRIRMVNTSGIISTIVGTGVAGFGGDGGQATLAELSSPYAIAIDAVNNLYIADQANQRIRKVDTSGIITTIAGTGTNGFSGDGGLATAAQLWNPQGITFDASGNLYISDSGNECVRKINTSGVITTFAGNGIYGFSGDGGMATAAQLWEPRGIVFDAANNLYISDFYNNRIRKVNSSGIISTVVGNGTQGFSGDGGQATAAEISAPFGLNFDAVGNLYIADYSNQRIRKVAMTTGINQATGKNEQTTVYPNPSSGTFTIETTSTAKQTVQISDLNGRLALSQNIHGTTNIDATNLCEGIYTLTIKTADSITNKRLVILR